MANENAPDIKASAVLAGNHNRVLVPRKKKDREGSSVAWGEKTEIVIFLRQALVGTW